MTKTFTCQSIVWMYTGKGVWHFVTLPIETAQEIDEYFAHAKRGWGSLPVMVTIGSTRWKTSIFPDKKTQSYLLPLKSEVRKKEQIKESDQIRLSLEISD